MCCYVYWGGADICERSHCEKSVTVYNNTAAFYRRHLSWAGAATCIICRDKYFVAKNIFWSQQKFFGHNKSFVEASILLSCQKMCFSRQTCLVRQTCVWHDNTFVTTKMILVAAPASDRHHVSQSLYQYTYMTCRLLGFCLLTLVSFFALCAAGGEFHRCQPVQAGPALHQLQICHSAQSQPLRCEPLLLQL